MTRTFLPRSRGDNTVLMLWVGKNLLAADEQRAIGRQPDAARRPRAREARRTRVRRIRAHSRLGSVWSGAGVRGAGDAGGVRRRTAGDARIGSIRPVLGRLRELFERTLVEQHRGWYLENEIFLTPPQSRGLAGEIDALCAGLAADAGALVDAFGIPAQCLASPIAE